MVETNQRPSPPALSVVIPCYNEELVLEELLRRVKKACQQCVQENYEIILVDDGSQDKSRALLIEAHQIDPKIVAVFLSRNHGHQLALSAGLSVAQGRRIFILDADLQDPPEFLSAMMARMDAGFDVVYGVRRSRDGESIFKKQSARIFYRLLKNMVKIDIPLDTGDFRLISRRVADILIAMPENDRFIRGMISWIGFPQTPFLYDRDVRHAGSSKYSLGKMLLLALDAMTGFSVAPFRIAMLLGGLLILLSGLYAIYAFIAWSQGSVISGWTSTTLIILLMGGVQFMMLGIIGEYVGRLFLQSKLRPIFLIETILRAETQQSVEKDNHLEKREHASA